MKGRGFHLFDTSVGWCAVVWGERGVVGVQLPEPTAAATRKRVRERFPGATETAPTRDVARAVRAILALLSGKGGDLSTVALDMDGLPPFHRRVYEAVRKIPPGTTKSYGEVANSLGSANSSRAVGGAMRRNPFPIIAPCHRVLAAGGKAGGFTAPGGVDTKKRMLAIEGVAIDVVKLGAAKASAKTSGKASPKMAAKIPAKPAVAKTSAKASSKPPVKVSAKRGAAKTRAKSSPDSAAKAPAKPAAAKPAAKPAPVTTSSFVPNDAIFDYRKAVRALKASDATLARLIDTVGPLRLDIKQTGSVFGALAEAIVYQQLNGRAAATIHGRLCDLFPRARDGFTPEHILGTDDDHLRGVGLSRAKAAAIKDLAQKTADRDIPTLAQIRKMPDDEIIASLTTVRGIGRWTVEMLLIFRLGRADVLPIDDFGVRKGYSIAFGTPEMPTPKELARIGEKWAPWRSAAAWYLWRATDLTRE